MSDGYLSKSGKPPPTYRTPVHFFLESSEMPRIPPALGRALSCPTRFLTPPSPLNPLLGIFLTQPKPILPPPRSTSTPITSVSYQIPSLLSASRNNGLGSFLLSSIQTPVFSAQQVRCGARGTEYQPSQRVRKRRHGFLARLKSRTGKKVLQRRRNKGRKFLSH